MSVSRFRKHIRLMEIFTGGLLMVVGVILFIGLFGGLSGWLYQWLPGAGG